MPDLPLVEQESRERFDPHVLAAMVAHRFDGDDDDRRGFLGKQFVADLVAGDFDEAQIANEVDSFIGENKVAMFSFTTCPFCRRAKDYLDDRGVSYATLELDEEEQGNQIRAVIGRKTKRTSMPAIFING